jgi:multimeric flavodoxin WrbA
MKKDLTKEQDMNVLLINGSPRQKGCTFTGLNIIKEQLAENGVDSTIYQVGNKRRRYRFGGKPCR